LSWLVLGDLHLQCYPKGVPASFSYIKNIFNQVEEYARKNAVDTVVQVGDVHDGAGVDEATRIFLLDQLHNSKLQWRLLMGNHDYTDSEYNTLKYYQALQKRLGILPNVQFYTEPTPDKLKGKFVAFLPWPHNKIKFSEPLICFAHFAAAGAKGDNGYVLKGDRYISKNHYWEIGDLHTPQRGSNWNYIGAPLQFKYGDTDKRFFGHFTGTAIKPKTTKIPIQLPYRIEQGTYTNPKDLDMLFKHLGKRETNEYTLLKLGEEILVDHRYDELSKQPRLTIEYAGKKQKDEEQQDTIVLIDSKSVRESLVRKRLKKKGHDKKTIDKAMSIVNSLEKENG
jgi:DNA repair exonuclease SbcCD nuclease subunit